MASAETARIYRRAARKAVIVAILGLALTVVGMRGAGYALFIGGGPTGETRNSLALLNCSYFTGTEKIINRMWRSAEGVKPGCPWVAKFADPRPGASGIPALPPG